MIFGTIRFIYHVFIATLRYTTITAIVTLVMLGSFSVYDFTVGENVPEIRCLTIYDREAVMSHVNTTRMFYSNFKEEECWDEIQPSLQILDKVCPEASEWVRDRYASGKIVWEEEFTGTYARYDYIDKSLTFNRILFIENDGIKASILAHEFRHSRQSFTKFYRSVIAYMICQETKPDIVENDAYLFEKRIIIAIFLGRDDL